MEEQVILCGNDTVDCSTREIRKENGVDKAFCNAKYPCYFRVIDAPHIIPTTPDEGTKKEDPAPKLGVEDKRPVVETLNQVAATGEPAIETRNLKEKKNDIIAEKSKAKISAVESATQAIKSDDKVSESDIKQFEEGRVYKFKTKTGDKVHTLEITKRKVSKRGAVRVEAILNGGKKPKMYSVKEKDGKEYVVIAQWKLRVYAD